MIAAIIGTGASGIAMRWYKPSAKLVTGYCLFLAAVSVAGKIALANVACPPLTIIGPNSL